MGKVILFIVGALAIAAMIPQLAVGYYVMAMANRIIGPSPSSIARGGPLQGVKVTGLREDGDKRTFAALASPGQFETGRSVFLHQTLGAGDMPETKDLPAGSAEQRVGAGAAALRLAREECERLVRSFASECTVDRAEASSLAGASGRFAVSLRLLFKPREPFALNGDAAASYRLVTVPVALERSELITTTSAPTVRDTLYRQAAEGCGPIRRSSGNCGLVSVTIRMSPERSSASVQRLTAHAVYGTLATGPVSASR